MPAPGRSGGRRIGPILIGGVVLVLILMVVAAVLVLGRKPPPQYVSKGGEEVYPAEILDIPPLEMKDIPLSVPLAPSTPQRKQLTVGVVVRFAPPEGETPDIKKLEKEFLPRVNNLKAEFRHIIIQKMNSKPYGKLSTNEVQDQLLKTFRREFNKELKRYDLHKMARVHDVMWGDFFWN